MHIHASRKAEPSKVQQSAVSQSTASLSRLFEQLLQLTSMHTAKWTESGDTEYSVREHGFSEQLL